MILTIFTPTYNRADKLSRVYESLKSQTSYDFEWLIIDDGSTDNTQETVKPFLCETKFNVRYYQQNNGGKHRAYNKALELSEGDYFFCVDSDDWIVESTVNNITEVAKKLNSNQFIVAYKKDEKGNLLSDEFPENVDYVKMEQLNEEYGCNGEFSLVFPAELAKKYLFPDFEGEKFITESVVYDRINKNSDAFLLPEVLTVCEYQQEGLTNNLNRIMKNNPAGYCLYFMQRIDMQKSLKSRIITAGKYHCFCSFAKKQKTKYVGTHKLLVSVSAPVGWIIRVYYKIMRGY